MTETNDGLCRQLIAAARDVQQNAYAPYSKFTVGAAVLGTNGKIYTGCNVENSSYGLTICAERNALIHAVSLGCREFQALAITGDSEDFTMPCGACRQVMAEFHVPYVVVTKPDDSYQILTLDELLPHSFSL